MIAASLAAATASANSPAERRDAAYKRIGEIERDVRELAGTSQPARAINNTRTRIYELQDMTSRMDPMLEQLGATSKDLREMKENWRKEWAVGPADAASQAAQEVALPKILAWLAAQGFKTVAVPVNIASRVIDVINYGGRYVIKQIDMAKFQELIDKNLVNYKDALEVFKQLHGELAAENAKLKLLRDLQQQHRAAFAEVAHANAEIKAEEKRNALLSKPARSYAVTGRETDSRGDEKLRSRTAAEQGVRLAAPQTKGGAPLSKVGGTGTPVLQSPYSPSTVSGYPGLPVLPGSFPVSIGTDGNEVCTYWTGLGSDQYFHAVDDEDGYPLPISEWLQAGDPDSIADLFDTLAGFAWISSQGGLEWLDSPAGRAWLASDAGDDWQDAKLHAPQAKPDEYVRVCEAYGSGFYYIPGTDTCLKIGGYIQPQIEQYGQPASFGDLKNYFSDFQKSYLPYAGPTSLSATPLSQLGGDGMLARVMREFASAPVQQSIPISDGPAVADADPAKLKRAFLDTIRQHRPDIADEIERGLEGDPTYAQWDQLMRAKLRDLEKQEKIATTLRDLVKQGKIPAVGGTDEQLANIENAIRLIQAWRMQGAMQEFRANGYKGSFPTDLADKLRPIFHSGQKEVALPDDVGKQLKQIEQADQPPAKKGATHETSGAQPTMTTPGSEAVSLHVKTTPGQQVQLFAEMPDLPGASGVKLDIGGPLADASADPGHDEHPVRGTADKDGNATLQIPYDARSTYGIPPNRNRFAITLEPKSYTSFVTPMPGNVGSIPGLWGTPQAQDGTPYTIDAQMIGIGGKNYLRFGIGYDGPAAGIGDASPARGQSSGLPQSGSDAVLNKLFAEWFAREVGGPGVQVAFEGDICRIVLPGPWIETMPESAGPPAPGEGLPGASISFQPGRRAVAGTP